MFRNQRHNHFRRDWQRQAYTARRNSGILLANIGRDLCTTLNTTFYVFRAPEVGRPIGFDGIAQRANGAWLWEQPTSAGYAAAEAFMVFPRPNAGSLDTIRTSGSGAGSVNFQFDLGPTIVPEGTVFDVVFRVVDSLSTSPTTDLRTDCFAVTVK